MFFDCSNCGLKNMDMEFIQFIINCFKDYYPWMLNYILVFEMPWVLNGKCLNICNGQGSRKRWSMGAPLGVSFGKSRSQLGIRCMSRSQIVPRESVGGSHKLLKWAGLKSLAYYTYGKDNLARLSFINIA